MGNAFDVVLTVPFADYAAGKPVEAGLRELGFHPATDGGRDVGDVWLRLNRKMPASMGWDQFRDAVLALPWHRWSAPTHLQVLWQDEHTTEDDSFGGRVSPYAWHHETWVVP